MKTFTLDTILPVVEKKAAVIEAVKYGFIAHSCDEITLPAPVHMMFNNGGVIKGDCHVKTAYSSSLPFYCVKVASGFYQNPKLGLPVNNGFVMLFSSETGQPLALFQDDGYLTSVRTAAAGALGVSLRKRSEPIKLGIVGTGHQAELQARWISYYNSVSQITIWGRSKSNADALCERLKNLEVNIEAAGSTRQMSDNSNVIVTTTPSSHPVLAADDIHAGQHIVALGSDSPGKIELEPSILSQAEQIILDDFEQCLHHGEFGHAVRRKLISEENYQSLGSYLASDLGSVFSSIDAITVVDLTGLGAQDLAVASMVWQSLSGSDH